MKRSMILCAVVIAVAVQPVHAHWFPGDPYKMHFPQLPDPFGWDINATTPKVLADDWLCTETGPVSDIHVWGSWEYGLPGEIRKVHVSIHKNVPADATAPFSRPGELLWQRDFFPGQFQVLDPYGTGEQGWHDPNTNEWRRPDHHTFHQINIRPIDDPFVQKRGTIYWLDVSVDVEAPPGAAARWGWKTSLEHFEDDAVWRDLDDPNQGWQPLVDPITGQTIDLAFVITPEPTSLLMLVAGGLLLAGCRRERRR